MTVKKGETLVDEFSELSEGDTLTVAVSDLKESEFKNRKVIIAQYDSLGGLVKTDKNADEPSYTGKSVSFEVEAKVLKETTSIKIFYWDINTFVPFMGVYVID